MIIMAISRVYAEYVEHVNNTGEAIHEVSFVRLLVKVIQSFLTESYKYTIHLFYCDFGYWKMKRKEHGLKRY